MIETHMRNNVQPLFNIIGSFIAPYTTPTALTCAAFISGIISACCIATHHLIAALVFLLASGLLDILDGTVARITDTTEHAGAFMDLISDRMVEAAIIIGFTIAYPIYYFAYILFLVAVLFHFSSFLAAGALFPNAGNKSMHYDKSAVERAEAFIVFAAMMLYPQAVNELLMTLNIAIIICGITRFKRVLDFAKTLRSKQT